MIEERLKYLEWDSEFFNKEIYRLDLEKGINLEELNSITQKIKCDLLYLFLKQELSTQSNENFFLADKKIIFEKNIDPTEHQTISPSIIPTYVLTSHLHELALLSGIYSRFKLDTRLDFKFGDLYKLWIEKSVSREMASEVFVYKEGEVDVGFVTIKKNENIGIIGLIAVNEMYHSKNIGSLLLQAVEYWCLNNDINIIEVATQLDNNKACHFYRKNGFDVKQIDYIYHYYKQ